jgi:hypothetical protein
MYLYIYMICIIIAFEFWLQNYEINDYLGIYLFLYTHNKY